MLDKKPITSATDIPADVKLNTPNDSPNGPRSFAVSIAPCTNRCPKDVIGINAPAPQCCTILSYIPNKSNDEPITTNKLVTCPGVRLVLSNIICDIRHTKPQNINEFTYITYLLHPN